MYRIIVISIIFLTLALSAYFYFFSRDIKNTNNTELIKENDGLVSYATSSLSNNLNFDTYNDNEYGFSFDYPKYMALDIHYEQNNLDTVKKILIRSNEKEMMESNRNTMQISIERGDINSVMTKYDMVSYEEFSSSTILINSMSGIIVNYRDSFSGEYQNDILLQINESYVMNASYSKSKSNDVTEFEPNTDFNTILQSIKVIKTKENP